MKTRRMFLVALCGMAMLMGTISCKKEKNENENADEEMRIEASLGDADGNAKTHLEGFKVVWDNTDAIKLYSGTYGKPFRYKESAGNEGRKAVFYGTRPGDAPYYAGYPGDKVSCDQAGVFKFQIPASQSENTNAGPMVGYMKDGNSTLVFHNAMSWLKVSLKGNAIIKRVVLTDKDNQMLNGTLTVTCSVNDGEFGFTTAMTEGTSQLEIVSNDVFLLNSTTPTYFWFMVPTGSLANVNLSAYVSDDPSASPVLNINRTISGGIVANTILTAEVSTPINATLSPTVTTNAGCNNDFVYELGATVKGNDANFTTYKVGLCYSKTVHEPTIDDCDGTEEIGIFSIPKNTTLDIKYDLTGLEVDHNYYVRAYATNGSLGYGTHKVIVGGNVPKPLPSNWTNGRNPHPFTVAPGKVVHFSQGNLQYNATGSSASVNLGENVGGTWRFAEHQFDIIGADNANAAQTYDGWIDLFGWGTSGYNHGATCYQPWSKNKSNEDYWAYGKVAYDLNTQTPTTADWGYNTISNGGANNWRVLTSDEFAYLLARKDSSENLLYGHGKVGNCKAGLIILPDNWTVPHGLTFIYGKSDWLNVYSYSEWALMEASGAVFLPAAGYRDDAIVSHVGMNGDYWSATHNSSGEAYNPHFFSENLYVGGAHNRYQGYSVRLVSDN